MGVREFAALTPMGLFYFLTTLTSFRSFGGSSTIERSIQEVSEPTPCFRTQIHKFLPFLLHFLLLAVLEELSELCA